MARRTKGRARRLAGRSFAGNTAVIILRGTGQVINRATVQDRTFRIETPDLGVLTIDTNKIKTIVYKNLPAYPTDMLRTINASEFNGDILNDPVTVTAEDLGGKVKLPRAKLLSIIW